jgi:hypothetical protein
LGFAKKPGKFRKVFGAEGLGYLNSVDEFLRGFKEENHVLGLVSRKGKDLGDRLGNSKIERFEN